MAPSCIYTHAHYCMNNYWGILGHVCHLNTARMNCGEGGLNSPPPPPPPPPHPLDLPLRREGSWEYYTTMGLFSRQINDSRDINILASFWICLILRDAYLSHWPLLCSSNGQLQSEWKPLLNSYYFINDLSYMCNCSLLKVVLVPHRIHKPIRYLYCY